MLRSFIFRGTVIILTIAFLMIANPRAPDHPFLLDLVIGKAALLGLLALVAIILAFQSQSFRRRYWWVLAAAVCYALLMPFAYMWIGPYHISLADAFFLRVLHAGSWLVSGGYAMLAGVVIGGVVGFVAIRPREK